MSVDIAITQKEFELFKDLIYQEFGISLSDRKITLVQSRLRKWVVKQNFRSYRDLYDHLKKNTDELILLADAITTNVTSFFREEAQWAYLKGYFEKFTQKSVDKKIRIWSAGCSSGQEPYSIAIFLQEHIEDISGWDIKILATDLSNDILKKASKGVYSEKEVEGMPKTYINRYFETFKDQVGIKFYRVKQNIKDMVLFRSFNLVTGNYGIFKNRFDLIFCRNVMIYFDKQTQKRVISRYIDLLRGDSLLLIGHSESITQHTDLKLIASSVYKKRSS